MKIGSLLRKIRKERGYTQKDLAKMVGKTDAHLNFLEKNSRSPSLTTLVKIAAALNVHPGHLLSDVYPADLIAETREQTMRSKQEIPLFSLEYFHQWSSKAWENLILRFGTKRSQVAGVKLYDDSMFPEFSKDEIVVIDRRYKCETDIKAGSQTLAKKIKSGVYVVCSITKQHCSYPFPNNVLRKIEIDRNGKNITLHALNPKFQTNVLNVRSDYYDEHNMDILYISGVVIGKMKFYQFPPEQSRTNEQ